MRIFLAGVSCVGKTAIGARLAGLLQFGFFDLDIETERFFGMSIERLRNRHLSSHGFHLARSQALNMFSLARTVTIASLRCHLAGYWVPSGKLSAKRQTPPRSCFEIRRRIFSGESLFTTSSPAQCKGI